MEDISNSDKVSNDQAVELLVQAGYLERDSAPGSVANNLDTTIYSGIQRSLYNYILYRKRYLQQSQQGDVDSVMAQLRKFMKGEKSKVEKSVTVPLVTFEDRNKFAKKTHNKVTRRTTYDFQRLTSEQQDRIDTAISNVMNEMFGDK
ncbi:ParB family protein [Vibrio mediterranei]|uniref:ParB family protein n=1 Tax=Vibrio mediterranei TaxID=689 RepID=UPI00148DBFEF|nr:ParB family protein [Vibrio mediterranei]NOI26644.1 hypothetical protein [Vibrio mediterranei]